MRSCKILSLMLLATMFFGCSDNVESKESGADDYEERLGRVYDQAEGAIRIALKERGVREGFDKSRGTITAVAVCAFDSDDEFRKAEEKADFSEEYDFKLPNGAGTKSQYAFLIWKSYANALAEIARAIACYLPVGTDQSKHLMPKRDDSSDGRQIVASATQSVKKIKVVERVFASDGDKAFAVAMALQSGLGKNEGRRVEGSMTLREWVRELCDNSLLGPASYVDSDGISWNAGVVLVDETLGKTGKAWSDQLAYRFAATMKGAEVMSYMSASKMVEAHDDDDYAIRERMETKVNIRPNVSVDPNSQNVRWMTINAENPIFGAVQYRVCAIQD